MKLILTALALVFLNGTAGAPPSPAQGNSRTAQQAIIQLEGYWLAHELSPAVQSKLLAPDFEHVLPGGIINRQQQLQYLRSHPDRFQGSRKFTRLQVRIYGDTAIATGTVVATPANGTGSRRTMFTDVFVRRHGVWQVVNSQENNAHAAPMH